MSEKTSNDFELVRVNNVQELHENLQKLMKNKKHIESIKVDHAMSEIRVDLSMMANGFGHQDFKLKLRPSKTSEAEVLLSRMKHEYEITRGQAEELYDMLQVGP